MLFTGHPTQFSKSDRIASFRSAKYSLPPSLMLVNVFFSFFSRSPGSGTERSKERSAWPFRRTGIRRHGKRREAAGPPPCIAMKKAAAGYLPLRVLSPPRRLTSEFGMGSGVSAWLSPPPTAERCPLRTECHCPPALLRRNCACMNRYG